MPDHRFCSLLAALAALTPVMAQGQNRSSANPRDQVPVAEAVPMAPAGASYPSGPYPGSAPGGYPQSYPPSVVYGGGTSGPIRLVDPNHRLEPGDLLNFRIEQDKEPPVSIIVSKAGEVAVDPLDRAVKIAGLTVSQATSMLKQLLERDYYYTATVRLDLVSTQPTQSVGYVYFSGAFQRIGKLEIMTDRPVKLSEIISTNGGFGRFANKRKVRVTRNPVGGGAPQVFSIDMKAVMEENKVEQDMGVKDGDQIWAPETFIRTN